MNPIPVKLFRPENWIPEDFGEIFSPEIVAKCREVQLPRLVSIALDTEGGDHSDLVRRWLASAYYGHQAPLICLADFGQLYWLILQDFYWVCFFGPRLGIRESIRDEFLKQGGERGWEMLRVESAHPHRMALDRLASAASLTTAAARNVRATLAVLAGESNSKAPNLWTLEESAARDFALVFDGLFNLGKLTRDDVECALQRAREGQR